MSAFTKMALLLSAVLMATPVSAQEATERGRGQQERRGDSGQGQRGGFINDAIRGVIDRMLSGSAEEFRERQTEMIFGMFARTYQLNNEQRDRLRAEIDKKNDEFRASLGDGAARVDELQEQMRAYVREQLKEAGGPAAIMRMMSDAKLRNMGREMRLLQGSGGLNMLRNLQGLEAMLPEEQVQAGRERSLQLRAMITQGLERMRGEADSGRGLFQELQQAAREFSSAGDDLQDLQRLREQIDELARRVDGRIAELGGRSGEAGRSGALHPWEEYTNRFIEHYQLDTSQVTAARSILKDITEQGAKTLESQSDRRARADELDNRAERRTLLAELEEPINELFEVLKKRLEAQLTAAQRRLPPMDGR